MIEKVVVHIDGRCRHRPATARDDELLDSTVDHQQLPTGTPAGTRSCTPPGRDVARPIPNEEGSLFSQGRGYHLPALTLSSQRLTPRIQKLDNAVALVDMVPAPSGALVRQSCCLSVAVPGN